MGLFQELRLVATGKPEDHKFTPPSIDDYVRNVLASQKAREIAMKNADAIIAQAEDDLIEAKKLAQDGIERAKRQLDQDRQKLIQALADAGVELEDIES